MIVFSTPDANGTVIEKGTVVERDMNEEKG